MGLCHHMVLCNVPQLTVANSNHKLHFISLNTYMKWCPNSILFCAWFGQNFGHGWQFTPVVRKLSVLLISICLPSVMCQNQPGVKSETRLQSGLANLTRFHHLYHYQLNSWMTTYSLLQLSITVFWQTAFPLCLNLSASCPCKASFKKILSVLNYRPVPNCAPFPRSLKKMPSINCSNIFKTIISYSL